MGKELVFTNITCPRMSQHCVLQREREMGSMGSSQLGKAEESPLFQMSQAPVLAGRCPPLMVDSHASQTLTAPWRKVTLTPCQTLRAIRTSSAPRYLSLPGHTLQRTESSGVKYNFNNASIAFIYIYIYFFFFLQGKSNFAGGFLDKA